MTAEPLSARLLLALTEECNPDAGNDQRGLRKDADKGGVPCRSVLLIELRRRQRPVLGARQHLPACGCLSISEHTPQIEKHAGSYVGPTSCVQSIVA